VEIDGKSLSRSQQYQGQTTSMTGWFFAAPVRSLERIVFRTGPVRREPNIDTEEIETDLPLAGSKDPSAVYYIKNLVIDSES
jgi:hypothetical protein